MIEQIVSDNSFNEKEVLKLVDKFPETFISFEKMKSEYTNNPFMHINVFHKDNDIAGFLQYDVLYDRIEIAQIEVQESFQRCGIASSLLEDLIKRATQLKNITLEVRKDNDKAIGLYRKFGFESVAIRPAYYNGIDGILMERKLK